MRRSQVRGSIRHADRSIETSVSVPRSAHRSDGRKLEELWWETSWTPKQSTRSTIEVMLKPFAMPEQEDDMDVNQNSCALRPQRERANPQRVKRAQPTAGEKSRANSRQYDLKLGEVVTTIPTVDFNVETVEHKNLSFTVQKDTKTIH